jgi:hypothetical protein
LTGRGLGTCPDESVVGGCAGALCLEGHCASMMSIVGLQPQPCSSGVRFAPFSPDMAMGCRHEICSLVWYTSCHSKLRTHSPSPDPSPLAVLVQRATIKVAEACFSNASWGSTMPRAAAAGGHPLAGLRVALCHCHCRLQCRAPRTERSHGAWDCGAARAVLTGTLMPPWTPKPQHRHLPQSESVSAAIL